MNDPLKPTPALLAKLGSLIVHVEEGSNAGGHEFDWSVVQMLIADQDVMDWVVSMEKLALVPVLRKGR